mmetsp:Transcript_36759/g.72329  ORF Transcript_36759/g.72329 Transcript_36759/m.72329 type:complete len:163 (-) Transcript_36759:126-614(-)
MRTSWWNLLYFAVFLHALAFVSVQSRTDSVPTSRHDMLKPSAVGAATGSPPRGLTADAAGAPSSSFIQKEATATRRSEEAKTDPPTEKAKGTEETQNTSEKKRILSTSTSTVKPIRMSSNGLVGILMGLFMTFIFVSGLSCLVGISVPTVFDDKVLPMNKEY